MPRHDMPALVKRQRGVLLEQAPMPRLERPDDVLVRVELAGVCRTDLYAADGRIACADGTILGHEGAGVVEQVGVGAAGFAPGDRVTVFPALACGACIACDKGRALDCMQWRMLGVAQHGVFAQWVVVPARNLHIMPPGMSMRHGAYAEPVAASLGALTAGIEPEGAGVVVGRGRIAALQARVLRANGFTQVTVVSPESLPAAEGGFAWGIETTPTAEVLAWLVQAVVRRGTVVLKSRPPAPVGLDMMAAVRRETRFCAVGWGPMGAALDLLASGSLDLAEVLGEEFTLGQHEAAFALAAQGEATKIFLRPGGL